MFFFCCNYLFMFLLSFIRISLRFLIPCNSWLDESRELEVKVSSQSEVSVTLARLFSSDISLAVSCSPRSYARSFVHSAPWQAAKLCISALPAATLWRDRKTQAADAAGGCQDYAWHCVARGGLAGRHCVRGGGGLSGCLGSVQHSCQRTHHISLCLSASH